VTVQEHHGNPMGERGVGEITDNLASCEWDERNEEYLLFGV